MFDPSRRMPPEDMDYLPVSEALDASLAGDPVPGALLEGFQREAFEDLLPYAEILAEAADANAGRERREAGEGRE